MFVRTISLLAALSLGACTSSHEEWASDLWNSDVVSAVDGVYVPLPSAGKLVRVQASGAIREVDLKGASPVRLISAPGGEKVLAFSQWTSCSDEAEDIVYVDDCPYDELEQNSEFNIVADGVLQHSVPIPPHLNTVDFSPDATIAVAYRDENLGDDLKIDGLADTGEVVFVDIVSGTIKGRVSVGFSPSRILFSPNGEAVVMSKSQVVAVDLTSFTVTVEAKLTLDADVLLQPSDADLVVDDNGATVLLLTIENSSDLYMFNLTSQSWNIENLGAVPTSLSVDEASKQTIFVFDATSKAVVLEHGDLSTVSTNVQESINLEEPANHSLVGPGFALLYHDNNSAVHDVYRLDLENKNTTEYVLENPVESMRLSASGLYAVAITRPSYDYDYYGSSYNDANYFWGISVLDMSGNDVVNMIAQSRPVGVELVENSQGSFALILMQDVDFLLKLDLSNPLAAEKIDLPAAPISIGVMPDGQFMITHDVVMGMISTLNPENDELKSVSGFALAGLLKEAKLPRRGEE